MYIIRRWNELAGLLYHRPLTRPDIALGPEKGGTAVFRQTLDVSGEKARIILVPLDESRWLLHIRSERCEISFYLSAGHVLDMVRKSSIYLQVSA